jgi:glycosyltransferase involved in cell wall biosynthesis
MPHAPDSGLLNMRILYLAHRIPYPPSKGDKIRSFNEIKYLSKSHEIDLVCLADDPEDLHYQKELQEYCDRALVVPLRKTQAIPRGLACLATGKPLSAGYFFSSKIQQTVDRWLSMKDYHAIICFSSPMAEYLFSSPLLTYRFPHRQGYGDKPIDRNPKLIMDFCDVDSDKWAQYAKLSSFPRSFLNGLESRKLAEYERKIAEQFDHSVFVSEKEAAIFKKQNPGIANIEVVPNGVDHEYFSVSGQGSGVRDQGSCLCPTPCALRPSQRLKAQGPSLGGKPDRYQDAPCSVLPAPRPPMLLFTGAMDYYANVDGVTWFSRRILPRIQKDNPAAQFYIVGSNPIRQIRGLENGNNITVTGFVEDIRPYYRMADVSVIPLRLARGVQNKVLEAMAMQKAVVTTSKAIQGINARNGEHVLVADDPMDFSNAVLSLLENEGLRDALGRKARRLVRTQYDWQINMNKFEQLLWKG